jgi:capsular exopolysaccharide synthesis family protein
MAHQSTLSTRSTTPSSWHPTDYLRMLYKRRWVAIPGFLFVFVTGAIGSIRTVPIYEARTQLLIEKDAKRATSINSVLEDRESWYEDDFYPTQQRILLSRTLALRTAERLEKTFRPEEVPAASAVSFSVSGIVSAAVGGVMSLVGSDAPAAPRGPADEALEASAEASAKAGRILGGLSITPVRNSRVFVLQFRSPDRWFATAAVNAHAAEYIAQSLEFRAAATQQMDKWLTASLEEQRKAVAESEARLQQYREANGTVPVSERDNIVVQKLAALNQSLVEARLERVNREVDYKMLTELEATGQPLDAFPAIMQNDSVKRIKAEMASRQAEVDRLVSLGAGEALPQMQGARRQLQTVKDSLQMEVTRIVTAVRTAYDTARAREQELQRNLNAQQGETLGLSKRMIDYAALEREANSNRQLYESLLTRVKETGAASDYQGTNIQVIDRAEIPSSAVLPRTQRDLLVAALGGCLLAMGLAFGFEYFDSRIKSPEEIKAHLGLPFLGLVPAVAGTAEKGEAPLLQSDVPVAFSESIRAIRTAVLFSSTEEQAHSVVVTSTGPSEGKTVISSSLAITLAQAGQRTLVIDADMRRPRMHEALDRPQEPGLSNVLVGEVKATDAVRTTSVPNLSVLAAGHIPPNPAELLGSKKYGDLLADLKTRFDWIIIDAPPVMPVTDASVVAHSAGGVLFVIGSEMTPRQTAATAIEQLRGANARFIGAVLNRANITRHAYYYAPYYRKEYAKYYQRTGTSA